MAPQRKAGRCSLTTKQLYEMLVPHTQGSRFYHKCLKVQVRRLTQPLCHIWSATPEIKNVVGYRALCKRVKPRTCRIGIGCAKLREDMCPVCHAYDHVLLPKMRVWLKHVHSAMKHKDASYWSGFAAADDMISKTFQLHDQPSFWRSLELYLASCPACRATFILYLILVRRSN